MRRCPDRRLRAERFFAGRRCERVPLNDIHARNQFRVLATGGLLEGLGDSGMLAMRLFLLDGVSCQPAHQIMLEQLEFPCARQHTQSVKSLSGQRDRTPSATAFVPHFHRIDRRIDRICAFRDPRCQKTTHQKKSDTSNYKPRGRSRANRRIGGPDLCG